MAQAPPAVVDGAKALYVEGKQLRERGDLAGSLERMRAAHALYATPITTLELGRALGLVGKYVEALDVLASVEALPPRPGESDKARRARDEARTLAADYAVKPAGLTLRISDARTQLALDGIAVPEARLAPAGDAEGMLVAALRVDPGEHQVIAQRADQRHAQTVRLAAGEQLTLTLLPEPPAAAPADAAQTATPDVQTTAQTATPRIVPPAPAGVSATPVTSAPAEPAARASSQRATRLLHAALAVSAAGLSVGAATGLTTLLRARTLKDRCTNDRCPPDAGLTRTRRIGNTANVAFATAGAGVVLALVAVGLQRRGGHAVSWRRVQQAAWIGATRGGFTW